MYRTPILTAILVCLVGASSCGSTGDGTVVARTAQSVTSDTPEVAQRQAQAPDGIETTPVESVPRPGPVTESQGSVTGIQGSVTESQASDAGARDVEDIWMELSTNPNDPTTALGAVCWLRWELGRTAMLESTGPTIESLVGTDTQASVRSLMSKTPQERITEVKESIDVARSTATQLSSDELKEFASSLADTLDKIASGSLTRTGILEIDVEGMPGVRAYEAALQSPTHGCVRP